MSRLNMSALARQHGVHRRTIARWQKNGWQPSDAPIKIVEQDQGARRDAHPPARNLGADRDPVDLVALKRDIAQWVGLHREVERLKRRQWRSRVSDQLCRFGFLIVGVAFFVVLAYAAVN